MEVSDILNIIKQINPFFVFSKLRAFVVGFPYLSLLCLCSLRATKTVNSFYSLAHFSQTSLRRVSPNPLMGSRNKNSGILDLRIDQFPNPSIRNPLICHYRFRLKVYPPSLWRACPLLAWFTRSLLGGPFSVTNAPLQPGWAFRSNRPLGNQIDKD